MASTQAQDQHQGAQQMFDHAVAMLPTQIGKAVRIFRDLGRSWPEPAPPRRTSENTTHIEVTGGPLGSPGLRPHLD